MRAARSCYDHLAGQLGVALADALEQRGLITASGPERYMLSEAGCHCLEQLGVAPAPLGAGLKGHARPCLDWTERRRHLAGVVPARLFSRLLELGWIQRGAENRAIFVTPSGRLGLKHSFGLVLQTDMAA